MKVKDRLLMAFEMGWFAVYGYYPQLTHSPIFMRDFLDRHFSAKWKD